MTKKNKKSSIEQRLMDTVKTQMEWIEAPAWKRIIAFIFDMFLILPITNYLLRFGSWIPAVLTAIYFIGCELSPWKGTVGKRMMSMKVLDDNHGKVDVFRLIIRYLTKIISLTLLGIGYWPLLFGSKKRPIPDRLTHTMVIALTPIKQKI